MIELIVKCFSFPIRTTAGELERKQGDLVGVLVYRCSEFHDKEFFLPKRKIVAALVTHDKGYGCGL